MHNSGTGPGWRGLTPEAGAGTGGALIGFQFRTESRAGMLHCYLCFRVKGISLRQSRGLGLGFGNPYKIPPRGNGRGVIYKLNR